MHQIHHGQVIFPPHFNTVTVREGLTTAMDDAGMAVVANAASGQTWPCPHCGGLGSMCDGMVAVGPEGVVESRPATTCWVCQGRRRVRVVPVEE